MDVPTKKHKKRISKWLIIFYFQCLWFGWIWDFLKLELSCLLPSPSPVATMGALNTLYKTFKISCWYSRIRWWKATPVLETCFFSLPFLLGCMLKTHSRNSQTMFVNCGGQNCSPSRYFPACRRQLNSRSWVFASTIVNFLGFLFYLPDWRQDLQTWQRLGGSRSDTKQGNTWHSSSPHHWVQPG